MSAKYAPRTALGRAINSFEDIAIAVILGVMTLVTFTNVALPYVFNSSLSGGETFTDAVRLAGPMRGK